MVAEPEGNAIVESATVAGDQGRLKTAGHNKILYCLCDRHSCIENSVIP